MTMSPFLKPAALTVALVAPVSLFAEEAHHPPAAV